jgi:glycerate dehydrogenase
MKIVVLDGYTLNPGDLSWEGMMSYGDVEIYERTPSDKILERCVGATVVFTNKVPLSKETIDNLLELKFIGVLATGYNIVDVAAAKNNNIIVTNIPGYSTDSVAQLTFAMILEFCHHAQRHSDSVIEGNWVASKDFSYWNFPLIELAGKTIGIIGFGSIGAKVGELANAFGMKVLATGRSYKEQPHLQNYKWVEMQELLQESDFVSIHCPLVPETKGLINKANLSLMKKSAFLINTSRGPIVVEQDLADALNNGIIAGAGIDVLSVEPPTKENPILTAKNCFITPHIAWATKEARIRLMNIATNNLAAFVAGNPVNVVN